MMKERNMHSVGQTITVMWWCKHLHKLFFFTLTGSDVCHWSVEGLLFMVQKEVEEVIVFWSDELTCGHVSLSHIHYR